MKSVFLLLLSLMTGYEAMFNVKGCQGGWIEFSCRYPDPTSAYQEINVRNRTKIIIASSSWWKTTDRVSIYNDKKDKKLRVIIKQLQHQDAGKWGCVVGSSHKPYRTVELEWETDHVVCQKPFSQTAYRRAQTTIICEYPEREYPSVKYLCKESNSVCEDILSTNSSLQSNGTFSLIKTHRGFRVSIRNVSAELQGVYWCGLKSDKDAHLAGIRKINLEVKDIRSFQRSPAVGETLEYWCGYPERAPINKFICKGDDPSVCQPLISRNNRNNGTFSMKDNEKERKIYIKVEGVKAEDAGTYWCGAKNTDNTHSNIFYHKFTMIVAPAPTESPGGIAGGIWFVISVVTCAVLLLLLFVFLSILICKRFSKNTTHAAEAAAQHVKEDYVYEEIQEHRHNQDSGNAMKSVYATVDFPRNPPASLHYSTINFNQSSDKAAGDRLILKPSSSTCEYSCVKQSPANTFTNRPSRPAEGPPYSRVNKPQRR